MHQTKAMQMMGVAIAVCALAYMSLTAFSSSESSPEQCPIGFLAFSVDTQYSISLDYEICAFEFVNLYADAHSCPGPTAIRSATTVVDVSELKHVRVRGRDSGRTMISFIFSSETSAVYKRSLYAEAEDGDFLESSPPFRKELRPFNEFLEMLKSETIIL